MEDLIQSVRPLSLAPSTFARGRSHNTPAKLTFSDTEKGEFAERAGRETEKLG